jgi:hypothetical protein
VGYLFGIVIISGEVLDGSYRYGQNEGGVYMLRLHVLGGG